MDFEASEVKPPREPPIPKCSYMFNVYNMIDVEAQVASYCPESYPNFFILKDQGDLRGKPVLQLEFLQQRQQEDATGRLKYSVKSMCVDKNNSNNK